MTAQIRCTCRTEQGVRVSRMCPPCRRAQRKGGLGTCFCCRSSMDRNGRGVCEGCIAAGCSRRMGLWRRGEACPERARNRKAGQAAWSNRKEDP